MPSNLKLVALGAMLLSLASCSLIDNEESELIDADESIEQAADDTVVETEANYVNSEYGFTFNFPSSWDDYEVQDRDLDWGDAGTSPSLDFGFTVNGEFVSLMNVSFYSQEQWDTVSQGMSPEMLGKSGKWVIAADGSQDAPEELSAQREDVNTILDSFEVK